MSTFSFFAPIPPVSDIVETIWDIDLPEAHSARTMTFRVLPAISPTLCLHYRVPATSNQRINPGNARQRVTGIQTGAIAVRPTGPLGAVIVHFRPEAAFRFIGGQMDALTDANIGLSDLFSPTEASRLEEMLGEATGPAQSPYPASASSGMMDGLANGNFAIRVGGHSRMLHGKLHRSYWGRPKCSFRDHCDP